MISIAPMADDTGQDPLCLKKSIGASTFPHGPNRGTFSKLIDGGTFVEPRGATDGDRIFNISGRIDQTEYSALDYFWRGWTVLVLAIEQGVFVGYVTDLDATNGALSMQFRPEGSMTEFYERWKLAQIALEA